MALSPHLPDLGALDLLRTVARTGSIAAAGRELGLTQQAVSARLRSVEKTVGVELLHRDRRGRRLGPEGALLADWATGVLDAARELDAAIAALRGAERTPPGSDGPDGSDVEWLEIAASSTVAEFLLPHWLVRLRAELGDDAAVSLAVRSTGHVAAAVLDGVATVGFVEGPELPEGLSAATVSSDRLELVVPPEHPWARRGITVDAGELAATPLVSREQGSGTRMVLDRVLAEAAPEVERPAPAHEMSASTAVRESVLAGAGPAVLSRLAVAADIEAGRLVAVSVAGVELTRELRAIWPEGPAPAGRARALLRIATEGRIR